MEKNMIVTQLPKFMHYGPDIKSVAFNEDNSVSIYFNDNTHQKYQMKNGNWVLIEYSDKNGVWSDLKTQPLFL